MTIINSTQLAKYFEHTLLDPMAVASDIRRICDEAVRYGFYGVCIQPRWVGPAADILHRTGIKVVSVAGFPFGTETAKVKAYAAEALIRDGADEVDMVADLAALLEGDATALRREFAAVLGACRVMRPVVPLKVIIESAALTETQIRFVCGIAQEAGVDFVKTSTGYHKAGGARVEDVRVMAEAAPRCRVKAAGGIKTLPQALAMIEAGATRIGASASVQILEQFGPGNEPAR